MERYEEAEPLLTRSYVAIRDQFGEDHPRTAAARRRVVALYEAWDKPEAAARYGAEARAGTDPSTSP
jgi:hypothetical protein